MIAIIYAGLSILPLGLLIFGSIFLKTRFKNLNVPVILSVGVVTLICEFLFFNSQYAEAIDHKLWNSVSTVVSYFPIWASLTVIAVSVVIFCLLEILKFKNKNHFIKISMLIAVCWISFRTYNLSAHLNSADHEIFKTITMLAKSDCPEDVIRKFANENNVDYQLAVAANPNVPADVVLKLSHSDNEMVRFYSTSSARLSNERLQEMKTNDVSKEVRKQAENELEFTRLIK